jgi:hypothetical protein
MLHTASVKLNSLHPLELSPPSGNSVQALEPGSRLSEIRARYIVPKIYYVTSSAEEHGTISVVTCSDSRVRRAHMYPTPCSNLLPDSGNVLGTIQWSLGEHRIGQELTV